MIHRPSPRASRLLSILATVGLAGCASTADFPSLAPRPIEAVARQPERAVTPPSRAVDPALNAQVATLAARLATQTSAWQAALATARTAVDRARGRPVGDESWITAQQALSRLESIREAAGGLVDELDALRLRQAESATPADSARLDATWTMATTRHAAAEADYRALAARLPSE